MHLSPIGTCFQLYSCAALDLAAIRKVIRAVHSQSAFDLLSNYCNFYLNFRNLIWQDSDILTYARAYMNHCVYGGIHSKCCCCCTTITCCSVHRKDSPNQQQFITTTPNIRSAGALLLPSSSTPLRKRVTRGQAGRMHTLSRARLFQEEKPNENTSCST